MIIFKEEQAIASAIQDNTSVSWVSKVDPHLGELPKSAIASLDQVNFQTPKTPDLFYTRSILVTTSINGNDDHFDPFETWAARKTPIDKPTNINHDQDQIIGHMTSQWAIDGDGNVIPDDTVAQDLPPLYHIANGSVIYTKFRDESLQDKVEGVIAKIQDGSMFVSMECSFSNFRYAITAPDGGKHLVDRNESTAFLTKHLRAYGGEGIFEGSKISRSLVNINFTGKGFVEDPANKDSVIFQSDKIKNFSFASKRVDWPFENEEIAEKGSSGVHTLCSPNLEDSENINMSDDARVKQLEQQIAELNKQIAQNDVVALETKIQDLAEEVKASKEENEKLVASLKEEQEAKACMCQQTEKIVEENKDLKAKVDELLAAEAEKEAKMKKDKRKKMLEEKGLASKEAEAQADVLEALDDDAFAIVIERFAPVKEQMGPTNPEETEAELEVEDKEEDKVDDKVAAASLQDEEGEATAAKISKLSAAFSQYSTFSNKKSTPTKETC